ncbi:TPA: sigma-70 family RNA polymerase sigma factor, partial [Streptococcus equi subsp. equi]|nr:sigma-70 family RNA polymerase sigma factor [Streptococcus equi subsp. equi]
MNQEIIKRLKNLRMIDTEIMSKRQEIAELRSKILKGQQYSDMPKVEKLGNGNEYLNIKIIDD